MSLGNQLLACLAISLVVIGGSAAVIKLGIEDAFGVIAMGVLAIGLVLLVVKKALGLFRGP
jgi:hypothetical protein